MKEVKHREIDRYSTSKEEHALIKEFMEDKRKDIDYYQWSELINVMEVIENSLPVQIDDDFQLLVYQASVSKVSPNLYVAQLQNKANLLVCDYSRVFMLVE